MEKIIKIGNSEYKIKFPTVGEMMDIEAFKMSYTNGKYIDYTFSVLKNHLFILDTADALAYFSVLIPELKSDLGIKNWKQIPHETLSIILKAYKKEFVPWYTPIVKDLYNFDASEDEQPKEKNTK